MKYNVGSLFAGVGGTCLGFKRASNDFQLVVANEWNKDVAATYEYNFDHSLIKGDIEKILSPEIAKSEQDVIELKEKRSQLLAQRIDVLTANFPCLNFENYRVEPFYSILKFVKQLEEAGQGKPRVIFLESVRGLLIHRQGNAFEFVKEQIKKMGYSVKHHKVFNTYEYTDLPLYKERFFIICFRDKEDEINFGSMEDIREIETTIKQRKKALSKIFDYTLTKEIDPTLYYTEEKYPHLFKNGQFNLAEQMTEMYEIYQIYQRGREVSIKKNQMGIYNIIRMGVPLIKVRDGIRKLSPKEWFNFHGFRVEEDFQFPSLMRNNALYEQVKYATPVDMVEILARKIMDTFIKSDLKFEGNIQKIENSQEHSKNFENQKESYRVQKSISLTLLKIFIAISSEENWKEDLEYISITGNFSLLNNLEPNKRYKTEFGLPNHRDLYSVEVDISENKIIFYTENQELKEYIKNISEEKEIKKIVEKHSKNNEQILLLLTTIYAAVKIGKTSEISKESHEANFQSKLREEIKKIYSQFQLELEKSFESYGNKKRIDIEFKLGNEELAIELKIIREKIDKGKFHEDIKKIKDYKFGIALCYDKDNHIFGKEGKQQKTNTKLKILELVYEDSIIYKLIEEIEVIHVTRNRNVKTKHKKHNERVQNKVKERKINMIFSIYNSELSEIKNR